MARSIFTHTLGSHGPDQDSGRGYSVRGPQASGTHLSGELLETQNRLASTQWVKICLPLNKTPGDSCLVVVGTVVCWGGGGFRHYPPTPGTVSSMSNKFMRQKLLVSSYQHKYSYQHHIDMNMNGLPVPFHWGENQTLDRFHDLPKSATKWGSAAGNPD